MNAQHINMWCIFLLLLIIYCVFVIISYGFRCELRGDYDNMSLCLRIYIFDWIEIFSFKIFLHQNNFYYALNKGQIKLIRGKIGHTEQDNIKDDKDIAKTNYYAYFARIIHDMPKLVFNNVQIMHSIDFDNEMNRVLFDQGLGVAVSIVKAVVYDKLQVKNIQISDIREKTNLRGFIAEIRFDFVLFKILFFMLHIISLKRKYTSKTVN